MSVNSATERILKLMNEAARNARKEERMNYLSGKLNAE